MSNIFAQLGSMSNTAPANDQESSDKDPVFADRTDDVELEEGEQPKDVETLAALTAKLDKVVTDIEQEATVEEQTPRPDSATPESEDEERDMTDVLSVASDLKEQSERVTSLDVLVRQQGARLAVLDQHDIAIRGVQDDISLIRGDIAKLMELMAATRTSLTEFQTHVGNKIADVERRAATKQLRVDVKSADVSIPPPAVVTATREKGKSAAVASVPTGKPAVADMSDW